MAKTVRHGTRNIANFLQDSFAECSYFQALRLLTRVQRDNLDVHGVQDVKEIAISSSVSLHYSDIEVQKLDLASFSIQTNLLSLYGYSSPLPIDTTIKLLASLQQDGDTAELEFIRLLQQYLHNIYFSNLSIYKSVFDVVENQNDRFSKLIYSFTGWRDQKIDEKINYAENNLMFFAALLGRKQRSITGLKVLIKGIRPELKFDCYSCVPYKILVPQQHRLRLRASKIRHNMVLGHRLSKTGGILELHLYNLSLLQWKGVLDVDDDWKYFFTVLRHYLGPSQLCKIVIYLAPGAAEAVCLESEKTRVGINSWLLSSNNLSHRVLPRSFMLPRN